MFLNNNYCCRNVSIQNGKVKNHSSTRESGVCVETNNTKYPQLNTLCCNNSLSLSKLHNHSSSTSLSYTVSSFNSIYTPLIYLPIVGQVSLVGNLSLPVLNGRWFESLRVRCYRIIYLRERVELEPLNKSPVRAELSSVEILLVEGISVLRNYSISVSP